MTSSSSRLSKATGSNTGIVDAPYAEQLVHVDHQNLRCEKGVEIKADPNNLGNVYVGFADTVTANSDETTDGMPLAANESIFLPIRNPADIWVVADDNYGQTVYYAII